MKIKKIKKIILLEAKKYATENGWNENMLESISQTSQFKYAEIMSLFPDGHKNLLEMYLNEINDQMTENSKKINLIGLRVHERIRALIVLRLQLMQSEKNLISKTFFYLLLPHNYKFALKNLTKTVDQIWFLSGDKSTDINYYSKRIILSSVYLAVMINFINNDDFNDTSNFLDKQLKRTTIIPKLKNKIKLISELAPDIINIRKKLKSIKL